MDAMSDLALFAYRTEYKDLPDELVQKEKDRILDTIGVGLAGAAAPGCSAIKDWALDQGGKAQSSLLIYGNKIPASHAGMVNATFFQALDFDETHDVAILHTHCTCVAAALAAAEYMGGCSGKEFITAVTLGAEIMGRIGRSIQSRPTFARTGALAGFAAAITIGKILKLSETEFIHALGIVLPQASCTLQSNIDGALVKRMHPAFGVRAAFFACEMAKRGITGAVGILEGKFGYMNLFEGGKYSREKIISRLGEEWDSLSLSFKAHPCSRDSAGALEAGMLLHEQGIRAEDIVKAEVYMPLAPYEVSGKKYSAISGNRVVECILSGAWAASVGLLYGHSDLRFFNAEGVQNAQLDELAKKIEVFADNTVPANAMTPVTIKAYLKDGQIVSSVCNNLLGSQKNPLTRSKLEEKFNMCADNAPIIITSAQREKMINSIDTLEKQLTTDDLLSSLILV